MRPFGCLGSGSPSVQATTRAIGRRLTPSANDTLTTALTPNPYGGPTSGELNSVNQVDLYVIQDIQAGDELSADLNASNSAGQPGDALRLFDGNGKQLAFRKTLCGPRRRH